MMILIYTRERSKKYSPPKKIDTPAEQGITPRNRVYSWTVPTITQGYILRIRLEKVHGWVLYFLTPEV